MKKTLIFVGVVIGSTVVLILTIHILGRVLAAIIATAVLLFTAVVYAKKTYDEWFEWFYHQPYPKYRDE